LAHVPGDILDSDNGHDDLPMPDVALILLCLRSKVKA